MARKTITQRIALEGGDAIANQLKALGAAGEKAFDQIRSAAVKADLAKFGTSLKTLGSDLATVGKRIALLGAGLTTAAAGAGVAVFGLAKSGAEAADAAGKAAQKTGLQVDAYGRLEFAAKQADVSQEQLVAGMSKLNKAIAEAATETKKTGDAVDTTGVKVTRFGDKTKDAAKKVDTAGNIFNRLGVKIKDINGKLRPTEAIVQDVAEAFARMPDGALKSALAIELFGKAGAELIPFLNQGRDGIRDLGKEAEKLGLIFTPAEAALGDALGDSLDSLAGALFGIRKKLGLLFAPIVLAGAEAFRDLIVDNKDAILAFGREAARVTAGVLGDLLHLLSGNSQNIKNPWIRDWGAAVVQFGNDVAGVFNGLVLPAFKALRDGAQFVAEQINRVFGTDITGGELALGTAVLSLVGAFSLLASTVGVVVAGIGLLAGAVGGIPLAIGAAVIAAGVALVAFWEEAQAGAAAGWQYIADAAASAWQAIVDGATGLWSQIVGAFQEGQQMAVAAFNEIVEAIVAAWGGLTDRLGQIAQQIVERIVGAFQGITARISAILNGIVAIAQSILGRVSALVDSVLSKIKSAIAYAKQLTGLGGGDSGGGGSTRGFARGGYLGSGPGTSTSDSILARLSVGEFVINAKIVKRLGAGFFTALNAGVMPNIEAFRGVAKGFSVGGMADHFNRSMSIPRFATGGSVPALAQSGSASGNRRTPIVLQLPGGEQIDDLTIGDIALNRLQQYLVQEAYTSVGRRPGRR
ncbi:MAG: hypothetical protein EOQ39_03665 [Mesorhizobium sp.]|uniref:hypothetical protein n=1 Tax=Mesorhizobium sp. TaxID=1871066 RepID=UPI000FE62EC7|nr:hypothetical protein [Mesorhizobium sp.]RWB09007.1 MAG: hypothetical protein EOQ37_05820 [Mesorhizobium sp.]RWB17428.1 MAG: hypothetical protein EOQ39_03665 [Mesorhizobium sp.]